jgi:hypothetical protein
MSTITKNTNTGNRYSNTRQKVGGGKFCKICKDVGKTHDEYTSHYVRETPSPNSRVVCPTLLAAVCRYCKEGGHTVKHCPKIEAKNRQEANVHRDQSRVISKNYCAEVTNTTNKVDTSAYAVLDFSSDEEEEEDNEDKEDKEDEEEEDKEDKEDEEDKEDKEDEEDKEEFMLKTSPFAPPTNDNVVSYSSILKKAPQKAPQKSNTPSQIESLIPSKLNFNDEDVVVVTLDTITKRWADEEDLDDALIFDFLTERPVFSDKSHPLHYYNNKMISNIVHKYTNGYTKKIRITEDAFGELFQQWDTEFFTENDASGTLKKMMNVDSCTNFQSRFMSVLSLFTR